jgi:2-methylcitrate dehydratase PrpD
MTAGYARLCLAYAGAVCLRRGTVGLGDFGRDALADPETLALAHRLFVHDDGNPDPNALAPQRVELDLADGTTLRAAVPAALGSPVRPLSPAAARAKFAACWAFVPDLPADQGAALWDLVASLDRLDDVRALASLAARG